MISSGVNVFLMNFLCIGAHLFYYAESRHLKPKFSNRAEFAQWADENPVLSGLTLTKPPYIGGFRHFAIENLV
jgi:hypothetical protein